MLCMYLGKKYTGNNGYTIATYGSRRPETRPDGSIAPEIICCGYYLPTVPRVEYCFSGQWEQNDKYGWQYRVDTCDIIKSKTRNGILHYLASDLMDGIDSQLARILYGRFQTVLFTVIETEPELLLEIPGITRERLKKILDSYVRYPQMMRLMKELSPFGITGTAVEQFYAKYGAKAWETYQNDPYVLIEFEDINFYTLDRIAAGMGIPRDDERRICGGIQHVLKVAAHGERDRQGARILKCSGHTALPTEAVAIYTAAYLGFFEAGIGIKTAFMQKAAACIDKLAERNVLMKCRDIRGTEYISLYFTGFAEKIISEMLLRQKQRPLEYEERHIRDLIRIQEQTEGIQLAQEQREAVVTCLRSPVAVITGKPGSGKTSVLRQIISIYKQLNKYGKVVLCAPTGIAAKRMREQTGEAASTIHKTLEISVENKLDNFYECEMLDADYVIIDEVSMLDVFVGAKLMSAIPSTAKILLCGDVGQLPSVDAGMVLKDIIDSQTVPVVRLTKLFRQEKGNSIPLNADKISAGTTNLLYDESFQMIGTQTFADAQEKIREEYLKQVENNGLDEVMILTPFRFKTETGVISLNRTLHNEVNPPVAGKREVMIYNKNNASGDLFREGDKVIQNKNSEEAVNGDVGYIDSIVYQSHKPHIRIKFDEGFVHYEKKELSNIDLAYAQTIHKAQGSEAKVVILNLMNGHGPMLRRNLIYTAVTRARKRLIIIGQKSAVEKAILNDEVDHRCTLLRGWLSGEIKAA